MILIKEPVLSYEGDYVILTSDFKIENNDQSLWYKIPKKFEDYVVLKNADAFLIGLLFLGLKTGNNIKVYAPVSAKLLYSVQHYLIPALCLANPVFKPIKIDVEEVNYADLNTGNIAGTGLSCGVDSFATYVDHLNEVGSFNIGYFTFFNVGSHGASGGEKARKVYNKRLEKANAFAKEVGKEIITIDSNISEVLKLHFQQTVTLRTVSCVLVLQKLFKNYYFASKNRFDYFKLHNVDTQDYDTLILNLLSTESTSFFSAVSNLTRMERTALIADTKETYAHLDVCIKPHNSKEFINCSKCEKCLRTLLTLDLLGKLENYYEVFNITEYKKRKQHYIGQVIANRNENQFSQELYAFLKERSSFSLNNYYGVAFSNINILKVGARKSIHRIYKTYKKI